jgi:hypothetical protein
MSSHDNHSDQEELASKLVERLAREPSLGVCTRAPSVLKRLLSSGASFASRKRWLQPRGVHSVAMPAHAGLCARSVAANRCSA